MVELTITSPVMTSLEVAAYLRLCAADATPEQAQSAVRSVHRLVQRGKLRPIQPGREYVFWREEVNRYIREETRTFEPRQRGALKECP